MVDKKWIKESTDVTKEKADTVSLEYDRIKYLALKKLLKSAMVWDKK